MSNMNLLAQPEHALKKDLEAALELLHRTATVEGEDNSEIISLVEDVSKAYQSISSIEEKWIEMSKSWKSAYDTYRSEETSRQLHLQQLEGKISDIERRARMTSGESAALERTIADQKSNLKALAEKVQDEETRVKSIEQQISTQKATLDETKEALETANKRIAQAEEMVPRLERDKAALELDKAKFIKQHEEMVDWHKKFKERQTLLKEECASYDQKKVELEEHEKKLPEAEEAARNMHEEDLNVHVKAQSASQLLDSKAKAQDATAEKIRQKAFNINKSLLNNNQRFARLQGVAAILKCTICLLDSKFPVDSIDDLSADAEVLENRVGNFASNMRQQIEISRMTAIDSSDSLNVSETARRELQPELRNTTQQLETKSTEVLELTHKLARRDLQDARISIDGALLAKDIEELKQNFKSSINASDICLAHQDLEIDRPEHAANIATARLTAMITSAESYCEALEMTKISLQKARKIVANKGEDRDSDRSDLAENALFAALNDGLISELQTYKGNPIRRTRFAKLQEQVTEETTKRGVRVESIMLGSDDNFIQSRKQKAVEIFASPHQPSSHQQVGATVKASFAGQETAESSGIGDVNYYSKFLSASALSEQSSTGSNILMSGLLTSSDTVQRSIEVETRNRTTQSIEPGTHLKQRVSGTPSTQQQSYV